MEMASKEAILANYHRVVEQIDQATRSVGRRPEEIKLVVVTKGHPYPVLHQAIEVGLRIFGENYTEEGIAKIQACPKQAEMEWHMIGHIQSRKASSVCEYFNWVHSLDSLKLANRLDRFAGELSRKLPVLLECNMSGEETKYGWPAWEKRMWGGLLDEIAKIVALPNLEVRGLMTMAPFLPAPEESRPYFQRLYHLQEFLKESFPQTTWNELSMGMSVDFMVAIQEGATQVRIGTAIMGSRSDHPK